MPLAAGARLGTYEILAPLGAGGMGEVYRARDTRLGREVAVKVLPAAVSNDSDRLARFEREARMVAAINHPNIVTLYSIEEAGGTRFITMELVEGRSLDRHVTPGGLPITNVIDIAVAIADALTAAHQKGVVHRDLKPANVILTQDGRIKVLDFGLAKPADERIALETTQAATVAVPVSTVGQVVGTVPYMAPEQIRGEAVDARTDLFALGIVLHELAAGRRPFAGATSADVSSAILRDTPQSLTAVRADVPDDLDLIVRRCLEKDPRHRVQTALEVGNALRRVRRDPELGKGLVSQKPATRGVASLAVLPFVNRSRDEENEYFSDGLTEQLMSVLAKIPGLRVAARTSSFHFKGRDTTIAEVGRSLNVASVLEGSVRKAGDRVRISAQLVNVSDGYHLWTETFDRTVDDIFAVQDEVARAVATALPGHLGVDEGRVATGRGAQNRDAFDAYLEGRFYWNKRTEADVRKAIAFFEQSISYDPEFAEAWAGLADAYVILPYYSMVPTREALTKSREAALRALDLRPDLGPAHATLGYALMADLEWAKAESEYRRAIELSPDDGTAHKWYADLLMMTGRWNAALRELRTALECDPLSANIWTIMGEWYWFQGQLGEAMAQYRKALELAPSLPLALELAARLCWQRGEIDEYFKLRERLEAVSQRVAVPTADLRAAYERGGRAEVLRAQLSAPVARLLPTDRARWHAELGDLDAAFRDLDESLAERELRLPYVTYFADFAPLWKDPRFEALLVRMGVRQAAGGPPAPPVPPVAPPASMPGASSARSSPPAAARAPAAVEAVPPSRGVARRASRAPLLTIAAFIAAVLVWVIWPKAGPRLSSRMTFRTLQLQTSDIGYPGMSNDGKWVAFPAADARGNWDLYFMNLKGGEPRRITSDSAFAIMDADVSPDGSQIVYSVVRVQPKLQVELRMVPSLGGTSRAIAPEGLAARFTPDGQRIGYIVAHDGTAAGHTDLWSVRSDGNDQRLEYRDTSNTAGLVSFDWSPDGRSIAWLRTFRDRSQELFVIPLGGGRERQLTHDGKNIDEVCWTAQNEIIFSSSRGGNSNLWIVRATGGLPTQITRGAGPDIGMSISADGRTLLYMQRQQIGRMWISSLVLPEPHPVPFEEARLGTPALSANGSRIAVPVFEPDPIQLVARLVIVDRDGSRRRAVTSGSDYVGSVMWAPRGNRLLYVVVRRGEPIDSASVFVADADAPGSERLVARATAARWIDSTHVMATRGGTMTVISMEDGRQEVLGTDSVWTFTPSGAAYQLRIDRRRGQQVSVLSRGTNGDLVARPVIGNNDPGYPSPRFDRWVRLRGRDRATIVRLPNLEETPIPGSLGPLSTDQASVSWDGREIIYNESLERSNLVLIEHLK